MSLAIVSAWSTKFPNNLFRQSHGLVKALTVSNSLNIQPLLLSPTCFKHYVSLQAGQFHCCCDLVAFFMSQSHKI